MWYRYSKIIIAKTRDEHLREIGVSEEVINFLNTNIHPNHLKAYLSAINKNPAISLTELKNLPVKSTEKDQEYQKHLEYFTTNYYMRKPNTQDLDVVFEKWLLVIVGKKIRAALLNGSPDYGLTLDEAYQWLDYYRDVKRHNPNFNIFNYNIEQIRDQSTEWHNVLAGKGAGLMYEPTKKENIVYEFKEPKGWTIQMVKSKNDLLVEGNRMNHCVGGYHEHVLHGYSRIYSLRDELNRPKATIEMKGNKYQDVAQIQAVNNTEPPQEIKKIIGEWLKTIPNVRMPINDDIDEKLDDLGYINDRYYDDKMMEILDSIMHGEDDYGLPINYKKDIIVFYENAEKRGNNNRYLPNWVHDIANTLASYAFEFDKLKLNDYISQNKKIDEISWNKESNIEYLRSKCYEHFDELHSDFDYDYYENLEDEKPDPENYKNGEDDEEYIKDFEKYEEKVQEHNDELFNEELERYTRDHMPYALDDSILDYIRKDEKEYNSLVSKVVVKANVQE
jgi:hypothetical protein